MRKQKTVTVNGERVRIVARSKTYMGNANGFSVVIQGKEYYQRNLDVDEAMDKALGRHLGTETSRTKAAEVMTPNHPRWKEFCNRLAGPEGCDFKKKPDGNAAWTCAGGNDRTFAAKILKAMNMDVAASLAFFSERGGHCDCEILFNVQ